jgi:hypothetical protein
MSPLRTLRLTLLATAAMTVALTGCESISKTFSGTEGRKEQVVDGPRRQPVLNPRSEAPSAPAAPARPQANAAPVADSPFDRFDARGNEIAPAPAQAAAPITMTAGEEDGEVGASFFDKLIPSRSAPEAAPQAIKPPAEPVRKPIAGNAAAKAAPAPVMVAVPEAAPAAPVAAPVMVPSPVATANTRDMPMLADEREITAEAPAPRAPLVLASREEDTVGGFVPLAVSPAADSSVDAVPVAQAVETPAEPAAVMRAPAARAPEKPSFFSRLTLPFTSRADDAPPAAAPSSEAAPAFPALSSVPATPERLTEVKEGRDAMMQSLQADHASAQESKQALEAEPSETAPVEPAPLLAAAKPAATPAPVAKAAMREEEEGDGDYDSPAEAAQASGNAQPVLLGRMGDPKLESAPQALPEAPEPRLAPVPEAFRPAAAPTPEAPVLSQPAPEPQDESPSWWQRLGSLSLSDESKPAQAEAVPTPVPLAMPREADSVPAFVPQTGSAPAPMLSKETPVAPAAAEDEKAADAPASESALPSASRLKEATPLPPSRYENRNRQYYLVP